MPAAPGIPLVFAGLVLLAWAENFAYVGWITLTLLGLLFDTLLKIALAFTMVGVFVLDRLLQAGRSAFQAEAARAYPQTFSGFNSAFGGAVL